VRYLILDLHLGLDSPQRSALLVYAISVPLALLAAGKIFGGF
jgi:hypothetical protein